MCGRVLYEPNESSYKVSCGGILAQEVTIRNSGSYLTLCEVEVYRSPLQSSKPLKPSKPSKFSKFSKLSKSDKSCRKEAFETTSVSLSEFKDCTTFTGSLVITSETLARFDFYSCAEGNCKFDIISLYLKSESPWALPYIIPEGRKPITHLLLSFLVKVT